MNYSQLRYLQEKPFFTTEDLRELLKIKRGSARVICSRYAKQGLFIRLKNNFYILRERWEAFEQEDLLKTANLLQVPSYVSFTTALSFYEITTQVQRNFIESASLKRSIKTEAGGVEFNYYKLKKEYYFDFTRKDGVFIASKEKAFLDALYLYSIGKYKLDFSAINTKSLDAARLRKLARIFPEKTRLLAQKLCKT